MDRVLKYTFANLNSTCYIFMLAYWILKSGIIFKMSIISYNIEEIIFIHSRERSIVG